MGLDSDSLVGCMIYVFVSFISITRDLKVSTVLCGKICLCGGDLGGDLIGEDVTQLNVYGVCIKLGLGE